MSCASVIRLAGSVPRKLKSESARRRRARSSAARARNADGFVRGGQGPEQRRCDTRRPAHVERVYG
jgi:hypothetical protein